MIASKETISNKIKEYAVELGFDACGFCKAESIGAEQSKLREWLDKGYNVDMTYLANNFDKRCDPTLLVDGARSIISLALNYYPERKQNPENPQFAYYAYGQDYHELMKAKLQKLLSYIQIVDPKASGRSFCDTAPILERYWAAKAGLGFIGKNTLLIIPQKGSYLFLGEIVVDIELEYDKPLDISCGNCTRCLTACPSKAIEKPHILNSNKCISYQTIENRGEIDSSIIPSLGNMIYGCDLCQQACPWNRFAKPNKAVEFTPSESFLSLSVDKLENMCIEEYRQIFKGSAVKRAKYAGLMRNLSALKASKGMK